MTNKMKSILAQPLVGLALAAIPMQASAYVPNPADLEIQILCALNETCTTQSSTASAVQGPKDGITTDGTKFIADPNPTSPSTGTGVFEPFVRIQRSTGNSGDYQVVDFDADGQVDDRVRSENGFNTDAPQADISYDTKNGKWTHALQWGDIDTSNGGITLQLDANQLGGSDTLKNQILITDMQIYIGSNPDLANPEATDLGDENSGYTGTPFNPGDNSLLNQNPEWTLDNGTNGDVDVRLQASICDSNGQCGSGHGDLSVFIPLTALASTTYADTDYFVFYSEYLKPNDGFEEWRILTTKDGGGGTPGGGEIPEPSTLALVGFGLLSTLGFSRRRRRDLA